MQHLIPGFFISCFYFYSIGDEVFIPDCPHIPKADCCTNQYKHCRSCDLKSPKHTFTIFYSIYFFLFSFFFSKPCVLHAASLGLSEQWIDFREAENPEIKRQIYCYRSWSEMTPLCSQTEKISHSLFLPVGRLPEDAAPLWNRLHPAWGPGSGERCVSSTGAQSPPSDHWYHTSTRGQVMVIRWFGWKSANDFLMTCNVWLATLSVLILTSAPHPGILAQSQFQFVGQLLMWYELSPYVCQQTVCA